MSVKEQDRSRVTVADPELKAEFDSHLGALRDLGPAYTDTIADSFLARVDTLIDQKIEARMGSRPAPSQQTIRSNERSGLWPMVAILALGIPLTAVAGDAAGFYGVIVVWVALAYILVNRR